MLRRRAAALYVATSPDGKIYHVAADGTSKVFFDPDDKYIWALAVDKSGNVFAATGDKGVIYKITPGGNGTVFYKTNTTNVVSLAFAPSGDLIAGTESPGRLFKLDATGKPFVLLDSPYRGDPQHPGGGGRHHLRRRDERRRRRPAGRARAESRTRSSPGCQRLDRDHRGGRGRHASRADPGHFHITAADRRPRRDLSRAARRFLGSALGNRRGHTVRPDRRAFGDGAGRHRHLGQDLPHQRRSGPGDAGDAGGRPAGDRAAARAVGADHRRDQQPGQARGARRGAGEARHLRLRRARRRDHRERGA